MPTNPSEDPANLHKAVLDAMPHPVFVVDDDVRIVDCNAAAQEFLGSAPELFISQKGGDALHCINAYEAPGGCGTGPDCQNCVIRNSVRDAFSGARATRRRCQVRLRRGKRNPDEEQMLVTTAPIAFAGRQLAILVLEDVTELLMLRAIVPICAGCRKIRDGADYWHQVENYFKSRLGMEFTHSLCPDCRAQLYPEFNLTPDSDR
jgi:hypothetical protein